MTRTKRTGMKTSCALTAFLVCAMLVIACFILTTPLKAEAAGETHTHTGYTAWSNTTSLPTSGSYYLTTNVTTDSISIEQDLNLCLNGYTVTVNGTIEVNGQKEDGTDTVFNLHDCKGTGIIKSGNVERASIIYLFSKATMNMYGGTLDGSGKNNCLQVYVGQNFNMYGGTITNGKSANGGGIFMRGRFSMYDGLITGNLAQNPVGAVGDPVANGGGVFVGHYGQFKMYGGKITNNHAKIAEGTTGTSHGGGICFDGYPDIWPSEIYGGEISGNSADLGGGVYAEMATVKFGVETTDYTVTSYPVIKNNTARQHGGGVYGINRGYLAFTNTVIENNTAETGQSGGIYYNVDELLLRNVTIRNNTAANAYSGGVIAMTVELSGRVIITGNTTHDGASANLSVYDSVTILDTLSADSEIGVVISEVLRVYCEESAFVTASDTDYSGVFISDSPLCQIIRKDDNSLHFGYIHRDHQWATEYSHNSSSHWYACVCDYEDCHFITGSPTQSLLKGYGSHEGGSAATCSTKKICDICHSGYGAYNKNVHESTEEKYISNGDGTHCRGMACCGAITDDHPWSCRGTGTATCARGKLCDSCGEPYGNPNSTNHHRGATAVNEGDTHYFTCDWCGIRMEERGHAWGLWIEGDGTTHTRTCIFCPATASDTCAGDACTSCVESEAHVHTVCGEATCTHGGDAHDTNIVYKPITQENLMSIIIVGTGLYEYCLPFGNYYLAEDITIPNNYGLRSPKDSGDINLCLAGKTLDIFDTKATVSLSVRQLGEFNVADCSAEGTGKITSCHANLPNSVTLVSISTNMVVYGGTYSVTRPIPKVTMFNVNSLKLGLRLYRAHLEGVTEQHIYGVTFNGSNAEKKSEIYHLTTSFRHIVSGDDYDIRLNTGSALKLYGTTPYRIQHTSPFSSGLYDMVRLDLSEYRGTATITIQDTTSNLEHGKLLFLGDTSQKLITNEGWSIDVTESNKKQYVTLAHVGHTGGTASCTAQAICDVCSQRYGGFAHTPGEDDHCTLCGELVINESTFPDTAFRTYVLTLAGAENHAFTAEELAAITEIRASEMGIYTLKGIEYFTSLTLLESYNNHLTTIPLEGLTKLSTVVISGQTIEITITEKTMSCDLASLFGDCENLKLFSGGTLSGTVITVNEGVTRVGFNVSLPSGKLLAGGIMVTNPHTHTHTEQPLETHLVTPANCTEYAVYYKSCDCGHASAETFMGTTLAPDVHIPNPNKSIHKGDPEVHTLSCVHCEAEYAEAYHEIVEGSHFCYTVYDKESAGVFVPYYLHFGFTCTTCGKLDICNAFLDAGNFDHNPYVDQLTEATCSTYGTYRYDDTVRIGDGTYTYVYVVDGIYYDGDRHEKDTTHVTHVAGGNHATVHDCCNAVIGEQEACKGGTATCTAQAICEVCKTPYGDLLAHDFTGGYVKDADGHQRECADCDALDTKARHAGGTATCTAQATCDACGEKYGNLLAHDFTGAAQKDADGHQLTCTGCDATDTKRAHAYGTDTTCNICGYETAAEGGCGQAAASAMIILVALSVCGICRFAWKAS